MKDDIYMAAGYVIGTLRKNGVEVGIRRGADFVNVYSDESDAEWKYSIAQEDGEEIMVYVSHRGWGDDDIWTDEEAKPFWEMVEAGAWDNVQPREKQDEKDE